VITIWIVTFFVGINGLRKTVKTWQGILVLLMFPVSIGLIAGMEKAGLD